MLEINGSDIYLTKGDTAYSPAEYAAAWEVRT